MTAMSSARRPTSDKKRGPRGTRASEKLSVEQSSRLDRERRPAAAAAGCVRVLEGEARFLEIALVVDVHAVQVLAAEAVDEEPHAARLDHHVVGLGLFFDAE